MFASFNRPDWRGGAANRGIIYASYPGNGLPCSVRKFGIGIGQDYACPDRGKA